MKTKCLQMNVYTKHLAFILLNCPCSSYLHQTTPTFASVSIPQAASRLYNAFQEGYAYKEADFGPEGDLFTPGIQHICGKIASNEDVRRVIMVHFEHTSPSLRLPIAALPSRHYHLPSHLSSFLLHIHDLDENKMDLSKVSLAGPVCTGRIQMFAVDEKVFFALCECVFCCCWFLSSVSKL